jgi:predicted solute-binding protein
MNELNCIVVGDDNYFNGYFKRGISFADEFSQFLDYPYVNFVLASRNKENIIELQENITDLDAKIEDVLNDYLQLLNMSPENRAFISENFNSVYFELTQNEINGLNETLRYPYLEGMLDDIVEVKFV